MHALRRVLIALPLVLAAACGSPQPESIPPDAGAPPAEEMLPPDAGITCGAGQHVADGGCDSTVIWKASASPFPAKLNHHTTAVMVAGDKRELVVTGGYDGKGFLDDVRLADIAADGSLGAWKDGPKLPAATAGAAVAVVGTTLVINGGMVGNTVNRQSLSATLAADGTLGPWMNGAGLLPTGRFHHSMVTDGTRLFIVGGNIGYDTLDDVLTATVDSTGKVSAWQKLGNLPASRSHHASVFNNGWIYVLGGLRGDPAGTNEPLQDVLRAQVNADGTLGPWRPDRKMPQTVGTHSAFVWDGWLYVVGGVEQNQFMVATVRRAPIHADGGLGLWEKATDLPSPRGHVHHTPVFEGRVYSIGGADMNMAPMNEVDVGHFE